MRKATVLFSILAASMMLIAIAPVMAKPNYVVITVKDSAHKPVYCSVGITGPNAVPITFTFITDSHGTVVIPMENLAPTYGWTSDTTLEVYINRPYDGNPDATITLNHKLSGRLKITWP